MYGSSIFSSIMTVVVMKVFESTETLFIVCVAISLLSTAYIMVFLPDPKSLVQGTITNSNKPGVGGQMWDIIKDKRMC